MSTNGIIPDKSLEQHAIALGKTGSGKSSAMRVLVERQLDQNKRVCIIDPKGDWYGLRSSADGKHDGYPVVIFGGEHADVPLNQHAGSHVAELVATGNRPCIIDLGNWQVGERTRFFIDFASALFRTNKTPMHLVIDEVHNFCPQGKIMDPDAGKMLHWSNRLASEGRGKGIVMLAASQRPQKVHKDFVTSCETLLAMRVIHPLDRNAIKDWIDGCPDREKGREVLDSLASMKRGEAWVWSPEIGFGPVRVKFPMFKTFDSFAAPTAQGAVKLKGWADVDLDEVKTKLQAVVEEAKSNDPRELKRQIVELKKQLSQRPSNEVERIVEKIVEVPVLKNGQLDRTEKIAARMESHAELFVKEAAELRRLIAPAARQPARPTAMVIARPVPARIERPQASRPQSSGDSDGSLPRGERAILIACAQYPAGVERQQLTILTAYKRSSRDAYIDRLRGRGFIFVQGNTIKATDDGVSALGHFEPLPTGDALREYWMAKLPQGERAMLEQLAAAYPNAVDRELLSTETGYQRSSRDAYLQRMQAKRLIETPSRGEVKAADELFG